MNLFLPSSLSSLYIAFDSCWSLNFSGTSSPRASQRTSTTSKWLPARAISCADLSSYPVALGSTLRLSQDWFSELNWNQHWPFWKKKMHYALVIMWHSLLYDKLILTNGHTSRNQVLAKTLILQVEILFWLQPSNLQQSFLLFAIFLGSDALGADLVELF